MCCRSNARHVTELFIFEVIALKRNLRVWESLRGFNVDSAK